jgi:hypothetical protein
MNSKELLETYPKAAEVVRKHFMDKLLESLNDADLPDDFKEFARQQEIDNDKIASLIDSQPRGLFDVFDNSDIFIQISVDLENKCFRYSFDGGKVESNDYTSRKEAESASIEAAFEILNEKL